MYYQEGENIMSLDIKKIESSENTESGNLKASEAVLEVYEGPKIVEVGSWNSVTGVSFPI